MITSLWKDQQRLDGRELTDHRHMSIKLAQERGNPKCGGKVIVNFGKTCVAASVAISIVEPKSQHPSRGVLKLEINSNLIKDKKTRKLRPSTESALILEPYVKDFLRESLDLDSLCIVAGEKVFQVNVNAVCQFDDGNVLDCLVFAIQTALHTFRRPDVTLSDDGEAIVHEDGASHDPVPLVLTGPRLFVTLNVVSAYNRVIVDCTRAEEMAYDGRYVLAMMPGPPEAPWKRRFQWALGEKAWLVESSFLDTEQICSLVADRAASLYALVGRVKAAWESSPEGGFEIQSQSYLSMPNVGNEGDVEELPEIHEAPEAVDMDVESGEEEQEEDTQHQDDDDWTRTEQLLSSIGRG